MNNTKITLRPKKFIEDKTEIECDSAAEILTIYDHFRSIASQYGIMTTTSEDIGIWTNPNFTPIPPTFPYSLDDF